MTGTADIAKLIAFGKSTADLIDEMRGDRPGKAIMTGFAVTMRDLAKALERSHDRADQQELSAGIYYEALREIWTLPEQGGCDSDVGPVELWSMMVRIAGKALDTNHEDDAQ